MMSSSPLRVAVVGYGLGGSVFHAPLIRATTGLSLDAVVTADPGRQAAAGARYPGTRILPGVAALVQQADAFDLAVVSVPNAAHVAVATAALQAGLHVVVDKPLAPTAAEIIDLGRLAADNERMIVPYHNRRWDGDFRTVAAIVAAGRLGRLWRMESRFERWKPNVAGRSWKQDPSQAAAGILFDLGTHLLDQALVLFGMPASVYAEVVNRRGAVDDDSFVSLSYPDGLVVQCWMSSNAAFQGPRFRLLGSDGAFQKFGLDGQEEALREGRTPADPGWGEEDPQRWGQLGVEGRAEAVPTLAGGYQDFYAGVAACLLDGAAPPVPLSDAVDVARLLEAAHRSAATGTVVRMG